MVKVLKDVAPGTVEMRKAYCDALVEAANTNADIVSINCDLESSMGMKAFRIHYPERAYNVGIAEANACSMAGGMSSAGLIPFLHTFAVFASRRICDQIFMSCAYPGLNVKIVGGDAGVSATYNGGTHMAFEDIGVISSIPGITILEPTDTVMVKSLVRQMVSSYGVHYMRIPRKQVPAVYAEGSEFPMGKAVVLKEGTDVTVIASGLMVSQALKAADMLSAQKISARIVDMFTVRPIDEEAVVESAILTGAVVTAENHQVHGGLGTMVAEVLAHRHPIPVEFVGVKGIFGEVGQQDYLMERFGLTAEAIVSACHRAIERKKK